MGIHVISPRIFPLLKEEGSFSIIKAYLRLISENNLIIGFEADQSNWLDLGKKESFEAIDSTFNQIYFDKLQKI